MRTLARSGRSSWLVATRKVSTTADGRSEWTPTTRTSIGLAYVQLGEFERGIAALREAVRLENTPMMKAYLAYGYAMASRRDEAIALIEEVAEISRLHYTCAYEVAVSYSALGNRDEAFRWLEKALEDRADCIPFLNVDPRLDRLRPDPRFDQLVKRVGLRREDGLTNRP